MKRYLIAVTLLAALSLTACGTPDTPAESASSAAETESVTESASAETESITESETAAETEAETAHETAPQNEVGYEGMQEVPADAVSEGDYHISVDSSSSMFKIADCILHVSGGEMNADLIIDSQSYDLLFMGTEEAAKSAEKTDCIAYTVNEAGQSVFSVPVEALDKEIDCAALSAKKQEWYGRTLVFRADSLPDDAFAEKRYKTAADLNLADGEYTIEVTLAGGSGRASVQSPAKLTVKDGAATAEIIWSSNKYDYMLVGGEQYLPTSTEESSVFEIPVIGFGYAMPVSADTTAMSQPYEIEYTLFFDPATIS